MYILLSKIDNYLHNRFFHTRYFITVVYYAVVNRLDYHSLQKFNKLVRNLNFLGTANFCTRVPVTGEIYHFYINLTSYIYFSTSTISQSILK